MATVRWACVTVSQDKAHLFRACGGRSLFPGQLFIMVVGMCLEGCLAARHAHEAHPFIWWHTW